MFFDQGSEVLVRIFDEHKTDDAVKKNIDSINNFLFYGNLNIISL
jgi:hypothetical protein